MKKKFWLLISWILVCTMLYGCGENSEAGNAMTKEQVVSAVRNYMNDQEDKTSSSGNAGSLPSEADEKCAENPAEITKQPEDVRDTSAETTQAAEAEENVIPASESAPEKKETPAEENTLWDKMPEYTVIDLPESAFAKGAQTCRGMAPDGVTFLMGSGVAPYLYNIETESAIALVPASESTREVVRETVINGQTMNSENPAADAGNIAETVTKMDDEELLTALFSITTKGKVGCPTPVWPMLQTDGNYLLAADLSTIGYIVINCDTGEFYCSGDGYIGKGTPCALYERQLFLSPQPPLGVVSIVDLESGRWSEVDFTEADYLHSGTGTVKTMTVLPDGSLCASVRDKETDLDNGQDCAIVVRATNGAEEIYSLGKLCIGWEPDCLISVGSDYLIGFSRNYVLAMPPFLIDRKEGTVSLLYWAESMTVPLEEASFSGGKFEQPENFYGVMALETLADGKTVLMQGFDGLVILFRPETMEIQLPFGEEGSLSLLPVPYYNSNHYDTFFASHASGTGSYIVLSTDKKASEDLSAYESAIEAAGEGYAVIGVDADYPPFAYYDENNELTGIDIDLLNMIIDAMGGKAVFVALPFDSLFNSLESGDVILCASGLAYSDERDKAYLLSEPYFEATGFEGDTERFVFAASKDYPSLIEGVNEVLDEMIKDGTIREIFEKYGVQWIEP